MNLRGLILSMQVLVVTFNFILTLAQSAMLYITLLITALSQLVVQLFRGVVNLNWPLILECIGSTCALVANTILDGLSLTLSAIVYIVSGLAAILLEVVTVSSSVLVYGTKGFLVILLHMGTLISSALVYGTKGLLALAENAVESVQVLFEDKPLMSDKTVVSLLLGGFAILWIYGLYSLVIFCIRRYLRHKNRRHLQRNEVNANRQRRPIAVDETGPPARPPRVELRVDSPPIRRRNYRSVERANAFRIHRFLEGDRPGNAGRLRVNERVAPHVYDQADIDTLSRLLINDDYSSLKEGKSSSNKDVKPNIKQDPRSERSASWSIDESVDDSMVHTKVQELEAELQKEKEAKQCVVCLDRPRVVMMRPCNHYCVCEECSKHLSRCPICTKYFTRMEKVYNV